MSFRIDNQKLLEKYKAIWAKTENLNNIEINYLSVYDGRNIKTQIRRHDDKPYSNFRSSNAPGDDIECEYLTVISILSLLVYDKKYYLQIYLENCAYKIVNTQINDRLS